ncbi:hypothetical protein [Streptomyces chartreusis]|uniref:hypothetical protein n=1 Tax=Streptomyces chartreusis TaxID=1969 RepID=UPI00365167D1
MDQGLAAVLGGAVGALGASLVGALAFWQARWVTRQQLIGANAQWRRQVQRETYGLFATEYLKASQFLLRTGRATLDREYSEADLAGLAGTFDEHLHSLLAAMTTVGLEGPEELFDHANDAIDAVTAWWRAISDAARELAEGANSDDQERLVREALGKAGGQIGRFTSIAQDHLDRVVLG